MASFEYFIASSEKFFPDLSPVDLSCSLPRPSSCPWPLQGTRRAATCSTATATPRWGARAGSLGSGAPEFGDLGRFYFGARGCAFMRHGCALPLRLRLWLFVRRS